MKIQLKTITSGLMNQTVLRLCSDLVLSGSAFHSGANISIASSVFLVSSALNHYVSGMSADCTPSLLGTDKTVLVSSKRPTVCTDKVGVALTHDEYLRICVHFKGCQFVKCFSEAEGGAIFAVDCILTFVACSFSGCVAKFGGSLYASRCNTFQFNSSSITHSHAERFGAVYCDTKREEIAFFFESNVTGSSAKLFIAGIRVETTTPVFTDVSITNTHAPTWGAIWDWSAMPSVALYTRCKFVNCSSETEGAAVTLFHWLHHSVFDGCRFSMGKGPLPVFIYLYSTESEVAIKNCMFDRPSSQAVGDRFGNNTIDTSLGNSFVPMQHVKTFGID